MFFYFGIGKPIETPKIALENINNEIIDTYHSLFLKELKYLYESNVHTFWGKNKKRQPPQIQFI